MESKQRAGFAYCFVTLSGFREIKEGKTFRVPVIDMSLCTDCESCLELCPAVFKRNIDTGLIEVVELSEYPQLEIQEVINCCPKGCIEWEETDNCK